MQQQQGSHPQHAAYERSQVRGIERVLRRQVLATDWAWNWRFYRRVSWAIVADKLEERFRCAAIEAAATMPWEQLYVHRAHSARGVSLFYGVHDLQGIVEHDKEVGASLVVSQDSRGGVIVLFFPFESFNLRLSKPKVIWRALAGPADLSDAVIRSMLRDFIVYSRASSGLMAPMWRDRRRVAILEDRSRRLEGGYARTGVRGTAVAALVVGSLATVSLLGAWIATEKAAFEPIAGLVALGTGWIAALVQKLGGAMDRAMSKALEIEAIEREERDRRLEQKRAAIDKERARRSSQAAALDGTSSNVLDGCIQ
ncbi:hypothetical protein [Variovorax sp. Root318D1]|uniref:hypothetical protein n=1 Tax=Variovorax sp. Root318D1 TaxID=1736513 RepID=UPI0012FB508E|nr:hypothetical protein [Variovorax sp. Root318D1]